MHVCSHIQQRKKKKNEKPLCTDTQIHQSIITHHLCRNIWWLQSQILSITHVIEVFSLGCEVNRGGNHNLKLLHSFIRARAAAWRGNTVKG